MKDVLVIGGATLDSIISYEEMETLIHQKESSEKSYLLIEEGKKIEVKSQRFFSGGGATNAAVSFSLVGHKVKLFCKLGKDGVGEQVLQEIQSFGIDTSHVRFSSERGTATSYVVPSLSGDRTIFAYRGANTTLLGSELPLDQIAEADFLYITSLSEESAARLPEIVSHAKASGTSVAINPGSSQLKLGSSFLRDSLSNISTLILNYEEAQQLMHTLTESEKTDKAESAHEKLLELEMLPESFNLRGYFKVVHESGVQTVVVTNGGEGVYVSTGEQVLFHHAAKVEVVNTLGAGDAFGSSFVAAQQMGKSLEDAIRYGVCNSASVVRFPDAKTGLLNLDTLDAQVAEMDQNLLEVL